MLPDMTQRFPEGQSWFGGNSDDDYYSSWDSYYSDCGDGDFYNNKKYPKYKNKQSRKAKRVAFLKMRKKHYVEHEDLPF